VGEYRYAIAVGSNLGDRAGLITRAATTLDASGLARVVAQAPLIETAPVGGPEQPSYLNGAWLVASGLGPHQLLDLVRTIEDAFGRVRTVPWGPRTLDLDLLLREDGLVVDTPVLTIPHPRLHERRFVLEPLAAVAAGWRHPRLGVSIADLLRGLAKAPVAVIMPPGSRQA
jgi:2-amino-4-hydroxy-6-hydroxymethyldihydropteridine diphosphokinase